MLDPQSFVRHLHAERENRTCHWGFDASHWRSYVHLSDVHYKKPKNNPGSASNTDDFSNSKIDRLSPEVAQGVLEEVKRRFNNSKQPSRKKVSNCKIYLSL